MYPLAVAKNLSTLLLLFAALLCAPIGLSLSQNDSRALLAYGTSALLTMALAILLGFISRDARPRIHRKDALITVAMMWLMMGVLGGLPFLIEGSITDPAAALFEAVSGFTTTGATVVSDVDGLSDPTNLWRCLMHWIGGMGIVVLFVAVFPQIGVSAKQLFKNEAAGPIVDGFKPRIKETAFSLWIVYTILTMLCGVCLLAAGMNSYDAACHAMSTLGTGGFSTRGASTGFYQSPLIDWITCFFMFVAALNFGLFYDMARGRWRSLFHDKETRFYLMINLLVVMIVMWCILPLHGHDGIESLRHALFQTLAVTTTTGFMTEDFDTYPDIARYILFMCMFMGGCAGSTAGGLKAIRILAILKLVFRELALVIQPRQVIPVKVGQSTFPPNVLHAILTFSVAFFFLWAFASAILVAMGLDFISAMSATIACLASIGPGLNKVGPTQNFMIVPAAGKVLLSFCMIAGRLEIFALFAVFHPQCWRKG